MFRLLRKKYFDMSFEKTYFDMSFEIMTLK